METHTALVSHIFSYQTFLSFKCVTSSGIHFQLEHRMCSDGLHHHSPSLSLRSLAAQHLMLVQDIVPTPDYHLEIVLGCL